MANQSKLLDAACAMRGRMPLVLTVFAVMGVLSLVTYPFIEPGSPSQFVALVNIVLLAVGFFGVAGLYRYCAKRGMEEGDFDFATDDE